MRETTSASRDPRPGYAWPDWSRKAEAVTPVDVPRLLAPFDPLIRERARAAELFGFDYRFEAFVPAAKRVHGYYTMPVLQGDQLVARLDELEAVVQPALAGVDPGAGRGYRGQVDRLRNAIKERARNINEQIKRLPPEK